MKKHAAPVFLAVIVISSFSNCAGFLIRKDGFPSVIHSDYNEMDLEPGEVYSEDFYDRETDEIKASPYDITSSTYMILNMFRISADITPAQYSDLAKAFFTDIPELTSPTRNPVHIRNIAVGGALRGKNLVIEVFAFKPEEEGRDIPDMLLLFISNIIYEEEPRYDDDGEPLYKITEVPKDSKLNVFTGCAFFGSDISFFIADELPKITRRTKPEEKQMIAESMLFDDDPDNDEKVPGILDDILDDPATPNEVVAYAKFTYTLYWLSIGHYITASESLEDFRSTLIDIFPDPDSIPFFRFMKTSLDNLCKTISYLETGDEKYLEDDIWTPE